MWHRIAAALRALTGTRLAPRYGLDRSRLRPCIDGADATTLVATLIEYAVIIVLISGIWATGMCAMIAV